MNSMNIAQKLEGLPPLVAVARHTVKPKTRAIVAEAVGVVAFYLFVVALAVFVVVAL